MDQPSKTTGVNLIACRTEQNENLRIVKISLEATIIARPGTNDPNLLPVMKTETEYGKSFFLASIFGLAKPNIQATHSNLLERASFGLFRYEEATRF
jgi:hypothetical protein